jgi:ribosomal protein S6--L-glutamate ligase
LQCVLYLQEFIHHPGWDLRLFVLGETIVAGMRRHARQGWRTNVAQGGSAESYRPSAAERALALRAAHAVKCPMAGIDLLPGPNGEWYVLEINAVPGWRALSTVSGVDVAARVVEYLGKELNSPPPLA